MKNDLINKIEFDIYVNDEINKDPEYLLLEENFIMKEEDKLQEINKGIFFFSKLNIIKYIKILSII